MPELKLTDKDGKDLATVKEDGIMVLENGEKAPTSNIKEAIQWLKSVGKKKE
jgi:hypothetical protein